MMWKIVKVVHPIVVLNHMPAKSLERLTLDAARKLLAPLEGWKLVKDASSCDAIRASYTFKSYEDTWAFLTKVSMRAHMAGHHPLITTVYNKVDLELTTHDVGGLSEKDFQLAKRYARYAGQFH